MIGIFITGNHRMKNIYSKLIALAAGVCIGLFAMPSGYAQSFAVQSSTQLIPAYSVYLSDYATPGNEKLQVILVQRDLTQPSYQIRLVMVVELNGQVIMRTSRTFNPRPISLDPGIPTVISGAELSPYLDSRNIDFVGYSRDQYERTKALPEGSYRLCFIAYDYRRQDVQVSNDGCSFYYLSKNEPPLTNFPVCGNRIQINNPQQIIFSWLPRNTSSPNSAAETQYEFALYETRPAGRNPNDVVLTTQPVFRTVTDLTQLVYGPGEPLLFEGMNYVWRVRAMDKNGRDAFRNNGYSEVCTFRYGGFDPQFDIGVVKNLQAIGEADRRGRVWWETGEYDGYKVEYKKSGKDYRGEEYQWYYNNVPATQGEIKVYDLEPDTEYQARVTAKKNNSFGPYSEIIKFRTKPPAVYQCGENNLPQITPANPIAYASAGMVINARGFDMTLVEIAPLNQPGYYKGIGFINNKFFGGARFYTKFDHIFIDENRNVAGPDRIDLVTEGVANMIQQQLADQKQKALEYEGEQNKFEQQSDSDFQEQIFDTITIDSIMVNSAGEIVIVEGNGSETIIQQPVNSQTGQKENIKIVDGVGNQWTVDKEGNVNQTNKVAANSPNYVDVTKLDDFEKIVKEAIDSLYALKIHLRDSLAQIKKKDQKSLNETVALMDNIESNVEEEELVVDTENSAPELIVEINVLDSIVSVSVLKLEKIEATLTSLNGYLDKIKEFAKEIKASDNFDQIVAILERKKRITIFINDKLK